MDAASKIEPMGGFRFLAWTAAVIMEVSRSKFPRVVRIETTNHCNAHCAFCPSASMGGEKRKILLCNRCFMSFFRPKLSLRRGDIALTLPLFFALRKKMPGAHMG